MRRERERERQRAKYYYNWLGGRCARAAKHSHRLGGVAAGRMFADALAPITRCNYSSCRSTCYVYILMIIARAQKSSRSNNRIVFEQSERPVCSHAAPMYRCLSLFARPIEQKNTRAIAPPQVRLPLALLGRQKRIGHCGNRGSRPIRMATIHNWTYINFWCQYDWIIWPTNQLNGCAGTSYESCVQRVPICNGNQPTKTSWKLLNQRENDHRYWMKSHRPCRLTIRSRNARAPSDYRIPLTNRQII